MRFRQFAFGFFLMLASVAAVIAPARAQNAHHAVTVPMQLELDRPYIDITLTGPGGQVVKAHAWVDTGGGGILFSAGLARQLGLKPAGKPFHEEGLALAPVDMPAVRIGNEPIKLARGAAFIVTDEPKTLLRTDAQMQLPARVLRDYVVTFDYPAHTFTVAERGSAHATGTPMKTYIGESGMPVVWLSVAGQTDGFLLKIDGRDVTAMPYFRVVAWLSGKPGEMRTLALIRDGKPVTVKAVVRSVF